MNQGGIISVQVLNKVTSVCRRKLQMDWVEVDAVLLAVKAACDVVPLTLESHQKAVEIAKRYPLSFYDAHICAAAILSGAKKSAVRGYAKRDENRQRDHSQPVY